MLCVAVAQGDVVVGGVVVSQGYETMLLYQWHRAVLLCAAVVRGVVV